MRGAIHPLHSILHGVVLSRKKITGTTVPSHSLDSVLITARLPDVSLETCVNYRCSFSWFFSLSVKSFFHVTEKCARFYFQYF
jgi:hypothetical protein